MEDKRDTRAAALIFLIIVILLVLTGVFGLRLMPKIVNLLSNSNRIYDDKNDLIPPPPPTLLIPYTATNSANVTLSGQSEPGSRVYLTQGDISFGSSQTENNGVFKFENIALAEGNNMFRLIAMDPAGNQSPPTNVYTLEFIAKPPEIEIETPQNRQSVTSKKMTVRGTTDPQNKVFVNNRFVMLGNTGSFETTIILNVGENKLEVVAYDRAGGRTQKDLTVNLE